jgi:hypothetical protein
MLFVLASIAMIPVLGAQAVNDVSNKPVPVSSSKAESLTNSDVLRMSNAHLSDAAIIAKIDSMHGTFDVHTGALMVLKNAGVSDKVIEVVVQRYLATAASDSSNGLPYDDGSSEHLFGESICLLILVLVIGAFLLPLTL